MKDRKFAKARRVLAGMPALLLTFALVFAGCKNTMSPDPALEGTVGISGTAMVGQTLTANIGGLGGTGTIFYQWNRGDTAT